MTSHSDFIPNKYGKCFFKLFLKLNLFFFFVEVQSVYSVVSDSGVQQSNTVIYMCMRNKRTFIPFQMLFPYRLL